MLNQLFFVDLPHNLVNLILFIKFYIFFYVELVSNVISSFSTGSLIIKKINFLSLKPSSFQ